LLYQLSYLPIFLCRCLNNRNYLTKSMNVLQPLFAQKMNCMTRKLRKSSEKLRKRCNM